jgi:hypothetical protein
MQKNRERIPPMRGYDILHSNPPDAWGLHEADLPRLSAACLLSGDVALQDFGPLPLN